MEKGGCIVSEYMNMLDVAAILSMSLRPQALILMIKPRQAQYYTARGLLPISEKSFIDFRKALIVAKRLAASSPALFVLIGLSRATRR